MTAQKALGLVTTGVSLGIGMGVASAALKGVRGLTKPRRNKRCKKRKRCS